MSTAMAKVNPRLSRSLRATNKLELSRIFEYDQAERINLQMWRTNENNK